MDWSLFCDDAHYIESFFIVETLLQEIEYIWPWFGSEPKQTNNKKKTTFSAMDALQWMGAVRMRVQTADKNITIIHK